MNRSGLVAIVLAGGCGIGAGLGDDQPPPDAVVPTVPPEIDGQITLNEFMTVNALTTRDDDGVAGDWIELYNPTDVDISLHGYGVTDVLTHAGKIVLPEGAIIPAGGYLMLWADDNPGSGPTHLGFKLMREFGEIGLSRPDGSWIDRLSYGTQEVDFSAARQPDGSDAWVIQWHPTPDAANAAGDGQPLGLEDPSAPPEQVPAAGDISEQILGYDVLLEIALELTPDAAASLELEPFVEVPAQIVYDGRTYGPVGVRLKGQNSFLPFSQKPSLRIHVDWFDARARFFGLKDLTLNNMSNDWSMMHERLAYRVAREAGVPASRANHTLLTINGTFYGLYTNVETVKRKMIGRWFADDNGSLFEATDVDFVAGYIPRYELEFGPDDRSLLTGLASALTIAGADAAIAAAANYADMARFRRFWAMCSVIGQFDSFPYSLPGDDYFVYADPASGRLAFLPWGMDETFYSGSVDVTQINSVLARRCRESPACFQAYVAQVWDVLAMTEQLDLLGERARVAAEIAPYVSADTRKPYTTDTVLAAQTSMYWFIRERRTNLAAMLPAGSAP